VLQEEKRSVAPVTAEQRREQDAGTGRTLPGTPPAEARGGLAGAAANAEARAPAAAFADATMQQQGVEILSPDPASRWRVSGSTIERSTDAGATWQPQSLPIAAAFTAGASPQPSVCWLVGRRGVVLLSTDGNTWRRVAFPEAVDLAGITASSASTASVRTADGRVVTTTDGGASWF
jgi:photosystem II stability/assembly factor-like uncharacterized protein